MWRIVLMLLWFYLSPFYWSYYNYNRSSRTEVYCKKGVLGNFTKFTGKHLCQSLLFWCYCGFVWVIFTGVTTVITVISCVPRHVVLQKELNILQVFHLQNEKVQKKCQEIFSSTERLTLKNFIRKKRPINIAPGHWFDVAVANFKQIINNVSYNCKLNDWMTLTIFPWNQTNLE